FLSDHVPTEAAELRCRRNFERNKRNGRNDDGPIRILSLQKSTGMQTKSNNSLVTLAGFARFVHFVQGFCWRRRHENPRPARGEHSPPASAGHPARGAPP